MPVFLLKLATGIGIPPRFAKAAIIAAAAALLVLALFAAVKLHDRRVVKQANATQGLANAQADRKADTAAAEQRRSDDARVTTETQEVNHAVSKAGSDPAARRAAYYRCVGLQQAARAAKRVVPACG